MTVPEGTVQDVLDWVGDDPGRAQEALDAENAGQQRSTLITQLEAICPKEDNTVSDTATQAPDDTSPTSASEEVPRQGAPVEELAPGPEQPSEVVLDAAAQGTDIGPVHVRDADVEVADDAAIYHDPDGDEEQPIDAEQAETVQAVGGVNGLILSVNGQAFAFGPQFAASLKQAVDKAIAGLSL
jgi:hypothetical protein